MSQLCISNEAKHSALIQNMNKRFTYVLAGMMGLTMWSGCKQRVTDETVKTTFVLSDTMLRTVTIDTAKMALAPDLAGELPAIPACAVITDGDRTFVMVFRDKFNVARREVKVATSQDGTAYIHAGLQAGEKVVSRNQAQIYEALRP